MIRISGIVRAARAVQERLQRGIPEEERAAFLRDAADRLRAIELIFDDHDVAPADLPAPSRRAYAVLQEAAALAPEDLPVPNGAEAGTPHAAAAPLRIPGLVGALRRTLAALGSQGGGSQTIDEVSRAARTLVEQVRARCEGAGATPAALPTPSGHAFGLLAWLAEPENAARYAAQHDVAMAHLEPALCAEVPGSQGILRITFEPGGAIHVLRRRGRLLHLKLSVGYLAASPAEFEDLLQTYLPRAAPPSKEQALEATRRYRRLHASEPYTAFIRAIHDCWKGSAGCSRGRAYDLDVLFERLNEAYFEGGMEKPRLAWRPSLALRKFGSYDQVRDLVVLDARLDDPGVPEFVAECVLFHELLHKHYGSPTVAGRRRVHPPHFKRHEATHPKFQDSEQWLQTLVARERDPS